MIQPPSGLGRRSGARSATLLAVVVLGLAIPVAGIIGRRSASPSPVATAAAVATATFHPQVVILSRPSPAAPRLIIAAFAPGPAVMAVGNDRVWVASAGDNSLRRIAPDGSLDGDPVLLAPRATGAIVRGSGARGLMDPVVRASGAGLAIGLAGGVWVAGLPGALDLVGVDAASLSIIRRIALPSPATGIAGGFNRAWVTLADGQILRADTTGPTPVFGTLGTEVHVALGERYVWVSQADAIVARDPETLAVVARFRAGGGPIAVDDSGSVWALGLVGQSEDVTRIDEASLQVIDQSDVATTGYSGIAWSLPGIRPSSYGLNDTDVAPRQLGGAIVGPVAWVVRPEVGELWRITARSASGGSTPSIAPSTAP